MMMRSVSLLAFMSLLSAALLYAAPVAYSLEAVPANLRPFFDLNPLTWFLEAYRWSLLGLPAPPWWQIIGMLAAGVTGFVIGALIFSSFERDFADLI